MSQRKTAANVKPMSPVMKPPKPPLDDAQKAPATTKAPRTYIAASSERRRIAATTPPMIARRTRPDANREIVRSSMRPRPNEKKMSDGWPAAAGKLCGASPRVGGGISWKMRNRACQSSRCIAWLDLERVEMLQKLISALVALASKII